MRKIKTWSPDDFNYLINEYFNNRRIKEIAFDMGRTVSSLSKVILRYNLQALRRTTSLKDLNIKFKIPKSHKKTIFHSRIDPALERHWVRMDVMINWLEDQHIQIECIEDIANELHYKWDHQLLTQSMLVYKANQLRVKKGLPIFYVHAITDKY